MSKNNHSSKYPSRKYRHGPRLAPNIIRYHKRVIKNFWAAVSMKEYWQEKSTAAKEFSGYLIEEDEADMLAQEHDRDYEYYANEDMGKYYDNYYDDYADGYDPYDSYDNDDYSIFNR